MRVIVYGPHTLNKPTLDKPETPIYLSSCGYNEVCYQDAGVWGFTSWKVPQGASFKVCVTSNNGNVSCDWGYADSRDESIHVQADLRNEFESKRNNEKVRKNNSRCWCPSDAQK